MNFFPLFAGNYKKNVTSPSQDIWVSLVNKVFNMSKMNALVCHWSVKYLKKITK